MKNFLTLVCIFICSITSAQIVNIPDPHFKNWLVTNSGINTNSDNEIQLSEALAVTSINVTAGGDLQYTTDFTGIRSFANLTMFTIFAFDSVTTLDLSGMAALKGVWVHSALSLNSINTTGCTNLETLDFEHTNFSSLNVSHLQKLKRLEMYADPHVTELIAENCASLKIVSLENPVIDYINLRNCDSLVDFRPDDVLSKKIDLTGCDALPQLYLSVWGLDTLILNNCTHLQKVGGATPGTISITKMVDFTGCIGLDSLNLTGFELREVDLSTCINLRKFRWDRSPNTNHYAYINLKNGSALTYLNVISPYSHDTLYICTDDFETAFVTASLSSFINGTRVANVNSYCSFTGGGNYNTIHGKMKLDMNNNGCDAGDIGMGNVPITFLNNTTGETFTNSTYTTGDYAFYTYKGNFTLTPAFPNPYFSVSPATANVVFDTANNLIATRDFCISPNGNHNDFDINFYPASAPPRPGMLVDYWLEFKNKGTTALSGSVQLNFDNNRMTVDPQTINDASSSSPGQLIWNFPILQPFQSGSILVTFHMLPPPANNVHDSISFSGFVSPIAGDETPADNSFAIVQEVRGSWDPNDIQCMEGAKIKLTSLNDPLHYMIRFQNTGTDTAFNVVVVDTLSNNYDWNSFEFIGSSHPCVVKHKGNKLEFSFPNINLAYQSINDAGSHGYIVFKVKPKNTLIMGDSLNNRAGIYFDFNLPVMTNKVATIISPTSTLAIKLDYFSLTGKEQSNLLTWKATATEGNTIFGIERSADGIHFNSIGNITATAERCQSPFTFTDDKTLTGKNYYRIKMTDANGIVLYSKTLVAGKTKQGLEINSITSDQSSTTLYISSSKQQTIQVIMAAADGKIIFKDTKTILAGTTQLNLPVKNMAKGITTLVVYNNEGDVITKRFVN
ncbi:MAG: hypothetical protein QM737_07270 [Ferruginibacter sp.]